MLVELHVDYLQALDRVEELVSRDGHLGDALQEVPVVAGQVRPLHQGSAARDDSAEGPHVPLHELEEELLVVGMVGVDQELTLDVVILSCLHRGDAALGGPELGDERGEEDEHRGDALLPVDHHAGFSLPLRDDAPEEVLPHSGGRHALEVVEEPLALLDLSVVVALVNGYDESGLLALDYVCEVLGFAAHGSSFFVFLDVGIQTPRRYVE